MAAVVLGCLLMSLLVGIIMASWAEQKRLLGDVLVSWKGVVAFVSYGVGYFVAGKRGFFV